MRTNTNPILRDVPVVSYFTYVFLRANVHDWLNCWLIGVHRRYKVMRQEEGGEVSEGEGQGLLSPESEEGEEDPGGEGSKKSTAL